MEYGKLSDIYRVESIARKDTFIANKLLENGWKLLGVEQLGDLSSDGSPESFVFLLLGASKDVFERYNLSEASPKSQYDNLF